MWRMMDNTWVMWPRQRFPLIALTCQYKWQQRIFPEWGGGGRTRTLCRSSLRKKSKNKKMFGKEIKLSAVVILTFLLNRQQCMLKRSKAAQYLVLRTWPPGRARPLASTKPNVSFYKKWKLKLREASDLPEWTLASVRIKRFPDYMPRPARFGSRLCSPDHRIS